MNAKSWSITIKCSTKQHDKGFFCMQIIKNFISTTCHLSLYFIHCDEELLTNVVRVNYLRGGEEKRRRVKGKEKGKSRRRQEKRGSEEEKNIGEEKSKQLFFSLLLCIKYFALNTIDSRQ